MRVFIKQADNAVAIYFNLNEGSEKLKLYSVCYSAIKSSHEFPTER